MVRLRNNVNIHLHVANSHFKEPESSRPLERNCKNKRHTNTTQLTHERNKTPHSTHLREPTTTTNPDVSNSNPSKDTTTTNITPPSKPKKKEIPNNVPPPPLPHTPNRPNPLRLLPRLPPNRTRPPRATNNRPPARARPSFAGRIQAESDFPRPARRSERSSSRRSRERRRGESVERDGRGVRGRSADG